MMLLLIILASIEILTYVLFRQHLYDKYRTWYYIVTLFNGLLSIWLWLLFIEVLLYRGLFDMPDHIWLLMNLAGMLFAVIFPRILMIMLHYTGRIIRAKTGGHIRSLTSTGIAIAICAFLIITSGTLIGRYNVKTEYTEIKLKELDDDLNGLKIVHLSDLHLASFYHNHKRVEKVMEEINSLKPDLIINTGDFISYGWREFDRFDTILTKARGRYGNFTSLGNHDFGTYHPYFTEADRGNHLLLLNKYLESSGYTVLNDTSQLVTIGDATVAIIGVSAKGSFPHITHGDLQRAIKGTDISDLKILLSHDPNHWINEVKGKTDIELTLAGHTHGMQIGITTKKFRWSPAIFFYPYWNGLYNEGDQFLYVNRGLGSLGIPFRIWMPPEITVITLVKD
ncbi:MAG: metallophosphoesterase [Bacteroidales bacterium]|nr:metallophosphoesterase [Bacteroidales bacterium]